MTASFPDGSQLPGSSDPRQGDSDRNPPSPIFTVVITTHNRAHLVTRAIESVLAQTFSYDELIIVDDASTDETPVTVAAYTGERVQYCRLDQNLGPGGARNRGLAAAHGQFIAFLDDDDRLEPEFLEVVHEALSSAPSSVGFLLTGIRLVQLVGDQETFLSEMSYSQFREGPNPGAAYLRRPAGSASGLVISAACARRTGPFDGDLPVGEDLDFMMRAALQHDFYLTRRPLVMMVNHAGDQLSRPSMLLADSVEKLIRKHKALLPRKYWPALIDRCLAVARVCYANGHRSRARRNMLQAVAIAPWKRRIWSRWLKFEMAAFLPEAERNRIFRHGRHG